MKSITLRRAAIALALAASPVLTGCGSSSGAAPVGSPARSRRSAEFILASAAAVSR